MMKDIRSDRVLPASTVGTPHYEVTISQTRPITLSRTFHIRGGTKEAALAEAKQRMAGYWLDILATGSVKLGEVFDRKLQADLREALQDY
jgi:hypothetical protein